MMKSIRSTKRESSMLISCIYGLVLALIVAMVLSIISAIFITNEYLDISTAQYLATTIHLIAVFAGSLLAVKIVTQRKFISCSAVCLVYIFAMVAAAILFFDGVSSDIFAGIVVSVLGGLGAFLLGVRGKSRSRGRGNKRSHR